MVVVLVVVVVVRLIVYHVLSKDGCCVKNVVLKGGNYGVLRGGEGRSVERPKYIPR